MDGTPGADGEIEGAAAQALALRVREELALRRMSRQGLADLARISISTLEKALSGRRPFTLASVIRLEDALGVRLRESPAPPSAPALGEASAPDSLGAYSRPAVRWLEGAYLTLRPSFGDADAVYAYRTDILWNDDASRLVFVERERLDAPYAQSGEVAAPHQSGHLYLVTNRHGQHRLITVGRPTIDGAMYGVLSTLLAGLGSQLTPIAAPIAFVRETDWSAAPLGRVRPGDAAYAACRERLDRVKGEGFALFR
ncbi:transcriptional regulator with XRE-family HTH domain [Methylopila capsulata]|uniref:Transcriptional regulator n=1 Tax=Methylopila capsulata TaxID=61654 RepID=A0A9W6IVX7_9HYPH|nr:helix-turn-helix transcriptional regulator [Methylopila capsulata]MBM7853200.1 transcriptional regulator with XRE-family HTH domain [Methylopila capsulata]GLK57586.1 transcriptional regulator [Methylopila capsulata]